MSNKTKFILSFIGFISATILLIICAYLAEYNLINPTFATILTSIMTALVIASVFPLAKIDRETNVYECGKCGHTFKPTFKAYIWGAHTLTKRHLKCPRCEEKSWCKRKPIN